MKYAIDMKLTDVLADIYERGDETTRGIIDDGIIELLCDLGFAPDDNSEYITDELEG